VTEHIKLIHDSRIVTFHSSRFTHHVSRLTPPVAVLQAQTKEPHAAAAKRAAGGAKWAVFLSVFAI
jgi:hypothetical protein